MSPWNSKIGLCENSTQPPKRYFRQNFWRKKFPLYSNLNLCSQYNYLCVSVYMYLYQNIPLCEPFFDYIAALLTERCSSCWLDLLVFMINTEMDVIFQSKEVAINIKLNFHYESLKHSCSYYLVFTSDFKIMIFPIDGKLRNFGKWQPIIGDYRPISYTYIIILVCIVSTVY